MSLEEDVGQVNEFYFLREFTFSSTKFSVGSGDLELADSIIVIGDSAIVFQLKERSEKVEGGLDDRWFDNKVIRKGSRQVRDTHTYLAKFPEFRVRNHRDHEIVVSKSRLRRVQSLIVYRTSGVLASANLCKKFYISSEVGEIHLMSYQDYKLVLQTLLTPAEILDFLYFRVALSTHWGTEVDQISEKSVLGQYLASGDAETAPSKSFEEFVDRVKHDDDAWDVSGILHKFLDRIYTEDSGVSYYGILEEICKLDRGGLREFKTRFRLGMERAAKDNPIPMRIAFPELGSSFVFVPVPLRLKDRRIDGLINFSLIGKYDLEQDRCVGVAFTSDGGGWYLVDWVYLTDPWKYDVEMDRHVKENNPFPPVRKAPATGYKFEPTKK